MAPVTFNRTNESRLNFSLVLEKISRSYRPQRWRGDLSEENCRECILWRTTFGDIKLKISVGHLARRGYCGLNVSAENTRRISSAKRAPFSTVLILFRSTLFRSMMSVKDKCIFPFACLCKQRHSAKAAALTRYSSVLTTYSFSFRG